MQILPPVRRYLINRHINAPEDWLTACIDWVLSEYTERQVPFIQEKVYQEWLHADLSELVTSCLPPQINEQVSTTLSGHFPLQINSVRDISEPAYAQLLKVDGVNTENTSVTATQNTKAPWERKGERMLMLQLTDGTVVVEGMEYRPVPCLSVSLNPGTKVMVFGTVVVRRGILFLTQQNITVLGGKVMSLLETNNQRNTLAAVLNAPDLNIGSEPEQEVNGDGGDWRGNDPPQSSGGEVRSHNGNQGHPVPSTSHADDSELDFFDDEFGEDLVAAETSMTDPQLQSEFDEEIELANEFDDDMDVFMSQI